MKLIERDKDENLPYGQKVQDTFHLSDFFIRFDGDDERLKHSIWRILDILFGHPYQTPTFDEYAMFLAFAASLRSADLSRQVGAVIAKEYEIIATGANDCPTYGGGLYWLEYDSNEKTYKDRDNGRDYIRGFDSNFVEQQKIIQEILENIQKIGVDREAIEKIFVKNRIEDLTEFGRIVHAEMEAFHC